MTDYPFNNYKPIAVCIFDKTDNKNNQTIFLSVQWASNNGNPSNEKKGVQWGLNGVYVNYSSDASSIETNNTVKSLNENPPAFYAAWKFKTFGTEEGDWYLPSVYDLTKYMNNYDQISGIFQSVQNLCGNDYLKDVNYSIWSCTTGARVNGSAKAITRTASS